MAVPKPKRGEEDKIFTPLEPERIDFDQAAIDLIASLGLEDLQVNKQKATINEPDVVYNHPKTNAKLFVGGNVPASTIEILEKYQIFNIVNCKGNDG